MLQNDTDWGQKCQKGQNRQFGLGTENISYPSKVFWGSNILFYQILRADFGNLQKPTPPQKPYASEENKPRSTQTPKTNHDKNQNNLRIAIVGH